jgi:hypothetical protein
MHQLVLFACVPADREPLADILVEHLGLTKTDAAIQARLAPGVLRGDFPHEKAAAAAAAIQQLGLQARALPAQDVPVLHPRERVHHLRWPEAGLLVLDSLGTSAETIRWAQLDLLSVGLIPSDSVTPGGPRSSSVLATGRQHLPDVEATRPHHAPQLALLLVCRDPFRVLWLEAPHLNYEFLGDRRTAGSAENFRLLVEDLLARAPHTSRTPATQAWLRGGPPEAYQFESPAALERATQLHLLIHRLAR